MVRKSIIILVSILAILSILAIPVSAQSKDNDNGGTPFQELWEAIKSINEQITSLQQQITGVISGPGSQESSPHPIIIQAHKDAVESTVSAGWVEIFEYKASQTMTLQDVQVYCSDAASNARVDIRSNGSSLTSAQPLTGGSAISLPIVQQNIGSGATISVVCYTDQPGSYINNLTVSITVNMN